MDILNFIYWVRSRRVVKSVDPAKTLIPVGLKDNRRDDGYLAGAISVEDLAAQLGGGGAGTDYIIVSAVGTPEENAQEFIAAYAKAVDADRDEENRFSLVLAPGHYKFQETFDHSKSNINIVSLTGQQDVIFDLELNGADPFVVSPRPPLPAFQYITDLTVDINDGALVFSNSLQSGQPGILNTTGQPLPEIVFDTNGLGYRGDPFNTTYPVYGGFSAGASDKVVASYKFTYNAYTGDNYQEYAISLYDNSLAILPLFENQNVNQCWGSIDNNSILRMSNSDSGIFGTGLFPPLIDGAEYTLELINDPGNSLQIVNIKDNTNTVIGNQSLPYVQISSSTYSVALGVNNQGSNYFPTLVDTSSVMDISADYSLVSGIKTKEYFSRNYQDWTINDGYGESNYYPLPLNVIVDNYDNLEVKNCTAGPFSFGTDWGPNNFNIGNTLEVKVTNCTALAYSFGYGSYRINSGSVFTDCTGGNYCFYIDDDLRGTYTNCTAGNYSFFSIDDDIEGTFTNCTAKEDSFRSSNDSIFGTFTNCIAEQGSFDADSRNDNDGDYYYCVLKNDTFRGGNLYYCVDDNY